jgi:hypothetical protein
MKPNLSRRGDRIPSLKPKLLPSLELDSPKAEPNLRFPDDPHHSPKSLPIGYAIETVAVGSELIQTHSLPLNRSPSVLKTPYFLE